MRLISWNVNGLRAVMNKGFEEIVKSFDADIFCLQETKCQPEQVKLKLDDYYQYYNSAERKGYSSTAVFSKIEPLNITFDFADMSNHPKEGRVMTLEFDDFYLVNAYVPNSKEKLARLDYRLKWENALLEHLNNLNKQKPVVYCGDLNKSPSSEIQQPKRKPIIYCGDLNVAFSDLDLKNPSANHFNPGFSDQERATFGKLLDSGFVDSYRYLYPDKVEYTWWSYKTRARERNAGWRIDYFLVSEQDKDLIIDSKIHTDIYGSDHCPIELDINL